MKKILIYIFCLAGIFTGCKDPYADIAFTQPNGTYPAATYLSLNKESLGTSLWIDVLNRATMYNTINLSATYTCFVPCDLAIKEYLTLKGYNSVSDIPVEEAQLLVRYHTIKGKSYSSMDFDNSVLADSTASGDYLSTQYLDGGIVNVNAEANVTKTIKVSNGYIHLLDKLLTPITETVWQKLQSLNKYTIFAEALQQTGYSDRLNTIVTSGVDINGYITYKRYKYTVLAVPDSVYQSKNINSFQQLSDSLKSATDYTSTTNALNVYMAYHMLSQQQSFIDLSTFSGTSTSRNISTMATNQLINLSIKDNRFYMNYKSATKKGTEFITINKNCKNGVIHSVSTILPVETPTPTQVKFELTDYSDLTTLPKYRAAQGDYSYLYMLSSGIACYNWMSVPSSKAGVGYYLASKSGNAIMNSAVNKDFLYLDLGTYGWVQMNLPAIIPGKYKVSLLYYSKLNATKAGKVTVIIDGAQIGAITTIGDSSTADKYSTTVVSSSLTFSTLGTHTLKLFTGDSNALYLDCIQFDPI